MSVRLSQIIRHLNTSVPGTASFAGDIAHTIVPTFSDTYLVVDERLGVRPIHEHLCTDTMVGTYAVFLDDEFVMLWRQKARKSRVELFAVGQAETEKLRKYLESFIAAEKPLSFPRWISSLVSGTSATTWLSSHIYCLLSTTVRFTEPKRATAGSTSTFSAPPPSTAPNTATRRSSPRTVRKFRWTMCCSLIRSTRSSMRSSWHDQLVRPRASRRRPSRQPMAAAQRSAQASPAPPPSADPLVDMERVLTKTNAAIEVCQRHKGQVVLQPQGDNSIKFTCKLFDTVPYSGVIK